MSVLLLRNTRVWVSTVETGFTAANTQEILVQDDLSFSQSSATTDISIDEAGPKPTRGSKRFTDAIDPAEFSFSTYILPYLDDKGTAGNTADDTVLTPDWMLWHALASGSAPDYTNTADKGVHSNSSNMVVSFKDNSYHELTKIFFYFLVDSRWYKVSKAQMNSAEISVDITDIAKVAWSGNGTLIEPLAAQPFDPSVIGVTDAQFLAYQSSYIKNKLSILELTDTKGNVLFDKVAITGATITINNNITFLTPSTLSRVDRPIGSFTGAFEVTGSLQTYLNTIANGSADLQARILAATGSVNAYNLVLSIGGKYPTGTKVPVVCIHIPLANLNVPELQTEDALSLNIEFKGQGPTLDSGDEIRISMSPLMDTDMIDRFVSTGDAKP